MEQQSVLDEIKAIEAEIATLPAGYISQKTIAGKLRMYYQWKEEGKLKSKYVKQDELEPLTAKIERRRALQARLKELKKGVPESVEEAIGCEMLVVAGKALSDFASVASALSRRSGYEKIASYLHARPADTLCLVLGPEGTGKSVLLKQALSELTPDKLRHTVYLRTSQEDTMERFERDLRHLYTHGFTHVFADDIFLIPGLVQALPTLADIYAARGMKLVLSGICPFGCHEIVKKELDGRVTLVETTYLSYREQLAHGGFESAFDFMHYGGTFRFGTRGEDGAIDLSTAVFRDGDSAKNYLAVCVGERLFTSVRKGTVLSSLSLEQIVSAVENLFLEVNGEFLSHILTKEAPAWDDHVRREKLDFVPATKRLAKLLEGKLRKIRNDLPVIQAVAIRNYLQESGILIPCPTEPASASKPLVPQPGLRYALVKELLHSLIWDERFPLVGEFQKNSLQERILQIVTDRLLADSVLLDTASRAEAGKRVFRFLDEGSFDMVVYDEKENVYTLCCVHATSQADTARLGYLTDPDYSATLEARFGKAVHRVLLYTGEDTQIGEVLCKNVTRYLQEL